MEKVRKHGRNLGEGRNRSDVMAEKIQRSHFSCSRELHVFLITQTPMHVRGYKGRGASSRTPRLIMRTRPVAKTRLVAKAREVERNRSQTAAAPGPRKVISSRMEVGDSNLIL